MRVHQRPAGGGGHGVVHAVCNGANRVVETSCVYHICAATANPAVTGAGTLLLAVPQRHLQQLCDHELLSPASIMLTPACHLSCVLFVPRDVQRPGLPGQPDGYLQRLPNWNHQLCAGSSSSDGLQP
jgi:hypothetical protein